MRGSYERVQLREIVQRVKLETFFLKHVTSERFRWPVAGVSRCDGKEAGRGSDRG